MFELLWIFVVVLLANIAERLSAWRIMAWGALLLTNGVLFAWAILLFLLGQALAIMEPSLGAAPFMEVAQLQMLTQPPFVLTLIATSLAATCVMLLPVRRFLSRFTALEADNVVHATALVFVVYAVGLSLAQLRIDIAQFVDQGMFQLTIFIAWFQGLAFSAFAFFGVGLFIRRSWAETLERLGIGMLTRRQLMVAIGIMLVLQLFDIIYSLVWQAVAPGSFAKVTNTMFGLFGGFLSIPGAMTLGLTAGIGEELLFRGAIQPRLGLWATSLLFALLHVQYGFSPALVEVFIIGLVLGYVRERDNTTSAIVIHALYNAINVLLSMRLFA